MNSSNVNVPYPIIASCLKDSSIILFLGTSCSYIGANMVPGVPSSFELAESLAHVSGYPGEVSDSVSKISQFVEEIPADRPFLIKQIKESFNTLPSTTYQTSVSAFINDLHNLQNYLLPKLIITTGYDTIIEQTLQNLGVKFYAISHIMRGSQFAGRFLIYSSLDGTLNKDNIVTNKDMNEFLGALDLQQVEPILIYKMHGTAHCQTNSNLLDTILITEDDYTDFLAKKTIQNRMPLRLIEILRSNRLLFLGYSLEDWNLRILLRRIRLLQSTRREESMKHWACVETADKVEKQFWQKRGINLYEVDLVEFLDQLKKSLQ